MLLHALRLLPLLALCLLPHGAAAWSAEGHRIVAGLAQQQISPATSAAVDELLHGLDDPSLTGIAVWADEVRGDEAWRHTARWHYVNFPDLGCRYEAARDCPGGDCIIEAINTQARILADPGQPRPLRVEALKFVVHFVGDVHQPMHAGLGADRGGNSFQVRDARGGSNLHAVWDGLILRSREPDWRAYLRILQQQPVPDDPAPEAENPPLAWAEESCRILSREGVYPPRKGFMVNAAYLDRHRPLAEARLLLAGTRLAALLDQALGHSE